MTMLGNMLYQQPEPELPRRGGGIHHADLECIDKVRAHSGWHVEVNLAGKPGFAFFASHFPSQGVEMLDPPRRVGRFSYLSASSV